VCFNAVGPKVAAPCTRPNAAARRFWSTPLIAVEGATLKSFAANRRDIPPNTAEDLQKPLSLQ
jgi:hypothetical protein